MVGQEEGAAEAVGCAEMVGAGDELGANVGVRVKFDDGELEGSNDACSCCNCLRSRFVSCSTFRTCTLLTTRKKGSQYLILRPLVS
jgi:hypothetical protein